MRRKIKILPVLLLLSVLTSCALAQPEAESGDQFAGLYVVPGSPVSLAGFWESGNPNMTAYGSERINVEGIGGLDFPQYVLFGEKSGDVYVFPGLEGGYSLFLLRGTLDSGAPLSSVISDMIQGEYNTYVSDEGTTNVISGSIYYGPPLGEENWDPGESFWTAYSVYQTRDGRPYLDGTPASFQGGIGSYTVTSTQRLTTNGKVSEDSLSVTVSDQVVPRLERVVVTQFSADNTVLCSVEIPLQDSLPAVVCEREAAWALVEEYSGEGVARTAYSLPTDDPISHQLVLLDEDGLGRPVRLDITQ